MTRTLFRTLIGFAIAIAVVLALGGLFKLYSDARLSEEQQEEVLNKAIPFVAVFVSIVIAFACVIVLVAIRFNGKVPTRSYRPIEMLFIAGILIGVLGLFQGWKMFAYEYGFLLLLGSLLCFMVWSHMAPMPGTLSRARVPLDRRAHLIALGIGVVIWVLAAAYMVNTVRPKAPYGYSPTVWRSLDADEQEQAKSDADDEYQNARIPVVIIISLLPGALVYFAARELVPAEPGAKVKIDSVAASSG